MRSRPSSRIHGSLVVLAWIGTTGRAAEEGKSPTKAPVKAESGTFSGQVRPFLTRYCTGCHGATKAKADLNLAAFSGEESVIRSRKVWVRVKEYVESGEMPPEDKTQPTQDEVDRFTGWVDATLAKFDCTSQSDPGRVTIRRLNRAEYNNTVRDLVGVDFRPAEDFPSDDVGHGFDNIGDVLTLPPLLFEKYLDAAEKIAEQAIMAGHTDRTGGDAKPESHRRIIFRTPTKENRSEAAREVVERVATRAFRRPVSPGEVARLVKFVDLALQNGDSFERGIQIAVEAVLVSPQFLFRVEDGPRPRGGRRDPKKPAEAFPVTDFELASRLSYFLWSSMPDDELFGLALKRKLREGGNLEAQVRRMLRDPKAIALVENFADQWLQLRNLKTVSPDKGKFPTFDEPLRAAMLAETERFFESIIRDDRSVLDLIDADFTFLNARLAKHYGIPGVEGENFRRVSLTGSARGGILTQASVLTVTSNPTRTSPVKRGKWIMEQILGTPPPPPPTDVPVLKDDKGGELKGTLRQRMVRHRENPNCASCHSKMDPLGFGFENFDAIGAWRDQDGGEPVDPSGVLPTGQKFRGPKELKSILKGREKDFARSLAEKMLTYALGRGVEYYDMCALDKIVEGTAKNGFRFSQLVLEVIKSEPFQKRKGRG